MRLSRRVSVLERREDQRLSNLRTRKKHKRLDAICENVYNRNHRGVKTESNEYNAEGDEAELRRSTRVRRAPAVLDASPPPPKKRRRVEFTSGTDSVGKGKRKDWVKNDSPCSTSGNVEKEPGSWKARLRDRVKNRHFRQMQRGDSSPRGKRRLFGESKEFHEGKAKNRESSDKDEIESGMSTVVKSKRPGRIKASNVLKTPHQESGSSSDKGDSSETKEVGVDREKDEFDGEKDKNEVEEHIEKDEIDVFKASDEKNPLHFRSGVDSGSECEINDGNATQVAEKEADEATVTLEKDEVHVFKAPDEKNPLHFRSEVESVSECEIKDGNATRVAEKEADKAAVILQSEDCTGGNNLETIVSDMQVELPMSIAEGENQRDSAQVGGVSTGQMEDRRSNENSLDDENASKNSRDQLGKLHLRVGRRCGLCGTGTDGKPPKQLAEDSMGSDHEAYSGSSASEEVNYDIWDGFGDEPGWLGCLLGPINDRYGIAGIWVHQHCAVWSPEVYFAGLGCLKNVRAALCRGRVLKCTRCRRPGATIGCRVDRCPKTYHLPCARANGCIFDHRKFLIACTDHRHLFQPHGNQYLHKIKKMKAKKMKLEMRKMSSDAWRKDLEAEEKWLENCGEDEEFLKRESKRLHRDLLRIAPVYIGGSNFDNEVQFQGWESVAGLQDVIRCLKEVVILPLLYPEFFSNMGLTPPRGVLLHGYPGTGKTLVVRALIGSCARGDKRIAYFARKGADCLGKYVGDAERQLRLLFQVAEKSQPSIIFFDEIDGLAPCRTRQQDQTHNSVVSTLLALLDGLKSRGSVVVIGATNRPDAVDPALRRPGRFDREIYFPLPSVQDREAILSLHTRKWPKPVTGSLLNQVARRTVGFAGADLQALCTQAAIIALRRNCPFQEILSAAEKKAAHGKRPTLPTFAVEERDWLEALRHAPPPCSQRGAEMAANDVVSSPLHKHLIPCLLQPLSIFLVSLYRDERILLPPPLLKAATLVRSVVVSALDKKKLPSDNLWFHVHDVLQEADVLRDIETKLSRCGIVIGEASDSNSNIGDEDTNHDKFKSRCPKVQQISTHPHLLHNVICASEKKLGFWLLISGSPRSGQRYLASCLLHCFTGNLEIQKIDLATISQEGQGDLMQGLTRILMKCASIGSSLIYMPRIDLWAIETCGQLNGNEDDSSIVNSELPDQEEGKLSEMAVSEDVSEKTATTCHGNDCDSSVVNSVLRGQEEGKLSEMAVSEDVSQKTSLIWNSFVEQVESISVASSLTILATSDLPFQALPQRIRQFFKSEKSDCRSSSPLEETIPRFSVHLDGDLNRDSVITLSAIELSKDLVQQFVQLIHHRVHVHSIPCTEDKSCDTLELYANTCRPANEHEKALFPERSFMKFSSPPNSRPSKGKSNLLLAISSLGYQILRYPHFAELCWVTSKLKEGPCTDIGGPWKGWPFNSCIVRPDNSSERVAVPCSSSNIKSRENFGLVRGLIAVGLLAYRGMYTTLRDVSSEVRKVFEFLADEINAKIQAGKDSYQYIRLLSQMAYLEDMLNSWAYTLRSLEEDAQATVPTSKLTDLRSLDSDMPFEGNTQHKDGCEPYIPAKSSIGVVEGNTQKFDLNKTVEDNYPNSEERIVTEEPPDQMFCHRSTSHLNEQDGNNTEQYSLGNPGNHLSYDGDFGSSRANGFAYTGSVYTEEDGSCSGNMGNAKSSSFEEVCNQHHDLTMDTYIPSTDGKPSSDEGQCPVDNTSSAGNETRVSNDSGVTCFYRCCSECLLSLRDTMGKILIHELGLRDSGFTVEDAHDLIVSLSTNLHSYLRKMFTAETSAIPIEGKLRQDKINKLFGYQQTESCQCKDSEDGSMMMMMECRCHSRSKKGENTITSPSQNFLEIDLKFICKDGVLSFLDPEDNAFHCKFETLCLCSLIEWIVMTKQPSGGYDFFAA